jgi:hypothetical protein
MQQQHNETINNTKKLQEQTTTILTYEYTKFKEIRKKPGRNHQA